MVFHANDGKSSTKIVLKKFTFVRDASVYECDLIDTSVWWNLLFHRKHIW